MWQPALFFKVDPKSNNKYMNQGRKVGMSGGTALFSLWLLFVFLFLLNTEIRILLMWILPRFVNVASKSQVYFGMKSFFIRIYFLSPSMYLLKSKKNVQKMNERNIDDFWFFVVEYSLCILICFRRSLCFWCEEKLTTMVHKINFGTASDRRLKPNDVALKTKPVDSKADHVDLEAADSDQNVAEKISLSPDVLGPKAHLLPTDADSRNVVTTVNRIM